MWAVGLMSGTSMDGIDVAIIETDGERVTATGPSGTVPYERAVREAIRAALGAPDPAEEVVRALTDAHASAVEDLLSRHAGYRERIVLVGFHGHTILHAPQRRLTVQAGDGARLAAALGIDVICDFRAADVAAGGQGAPFAPLFHRALSLGLDRAGGDAVAVLNIGGISNLTWIGGADEAPIAFDTGPGNALLDDWVARHAGVDFDRDGEISARGRIDAAALAVMLENPYYAAPPPKSLDRLDFDVKAVAGLSPEDGAATLAALTCETIAMQAAGFPRAVSRVLVTGGGRKNPTIMAGLAARMGVPVDPVEAVGWDGDALEAQAFAFLAVRSRRGLPLSLPTTTGVPAPMTGGRFFPAAPEVAAI